MIEQKGGEGWSWGGSRGGELHIRKKEKGKNIKRLQEGKKKK